MNIINISCLWFVSVSRILRDRWLSLDAAHTNIEYGDRSACSIAPCFCRRPGRSPSILWMGGTSSEWAAEECSDCRLGRRSYHHLHHPPFQCRLHVSGLCRWCPISGSLWVDLLWSSVSHTQKVSRAQVEPWKMEPTFPDCWHILERLGRRGAILPL